MESAGRGVATKCSRGRVLTPLSSRGPCNVPVRFDSPAALVTRGASGSLSFARERLGAHPRAKHARPLDLREQTAKTLVGGGAASSVLVSRSRSLRPTGGPRTSSTLRRGKNVLDGEHPNTSGASGAIRRRARRVLRTPRRPPAVPPQSAFFPIRSGVFFLAIWIGCRPWGRCGGMSLLRSGRREGRPRRSSPTSEDFVFGAADDPARGTTIGPVVAGTSRFPV